jgi:hypothetical protein
VEQHGLRKGGYADCVPHIPAQTAVATISANPAAPRECACAAVAAYATCAAVASRLAGATQQRVDEAALHETLIHLQTQSTPASAAAIAGAACPASSPVSAIAIACTAAAVAAIAPISAQSARGTCAARPTGDGGKLQAIYQRIGLSALRKYAAGETTAAGPPG